MYVSTSSLGLPVLLDGRVSNATLRQPGKAEEAPSPTRTFHLLILIAFQRFTISKPTSGEAASFVAPTNSSAPALYGTTPTRKLTVVSLAVALRYK